jgi:AraC-like DNA-binding protein
MERVSAVTAGRRIVVHPDFLRESTRVPTRAASDVLSEILDLIEVRGMLTGGFAVRGPWVSEGDVSRELKLVGIVAGSATLTVDGPGGTTGPVVLMPGDVVLLNHRTHLEMHGGTGSGPASSQVPEASFDTIALASADLDTDDVLVGGWIQVNPAGLALLRAALPGLVHIRSSPRSAALVHRLFEEASAGRLGSAFAIRQNAQLLLLEVLRASLGESTLPVGWLQLIADESLAPAIRLMHEQPGHPWGLIELARAAGMSRTTFASRFRTVAGVPPLGYLSRWRMLLAQRALRDPSARVGELAATLGYGSESAFSTAFKREVGVSPAAWRRTPGTLAE